MSLEQALQENTAAVKALTELLLKQSYSEVAAPAKQPEESKGATPGAHKDAGDGIKPEETVVTFEDLKKPFLKLTTKNRDAAVALLSGLGAARLGELETKEGVVFADVLTKIQEATNG